ncbi:MAG: response regulator [Candidatus Marinimicrobia bacterium]|nr:response regulator [Candidatus Neomarinimicrobiota bacterium]
MNRETTKQSREKRRILVAEDDLSSYMFFEVLLKDEDFEVLRAENGAEAVRLCREDPDIALVLLDIKMPGVDGYEAVRKIREFNKKIPVIAQTAYAFKKDRDKAMQAGCSDYITKPVEKELLMEKIYRYLPSGPGQ